MNRRDELDAMYLVLCRGCAGKICTVNCPGAEYDHCDDYNKAVRLYDAGWRKQKEAIWKLNRDGSGTCSACNFTQRGVWDYDNFQRYCGYCGAKMRLEEK